MAISRAMIVLPLFCFLFYTISTLSQPNTLLCYQTEKHALLSFKRALYDLAHRLSSWSAQEDCCAWNGVYYHNITGRVSPALLQLEFLNYLDLSFNDFEGTPIPSFLGSTQTLTRLDLFYGPFGGLIPPQLGNLSNLHSPGLGGYSSYESQLYVENLEVDLHREVHWLESTSMLSSLSELYLIECKLDNMSPSLGYVNFTSLTTLDLARNHFNYEIPNWLFNLSTSLLDLDLSYNSLKGHIPSTVLELRYLYVLHLSYNQLTGQIPEYLGQLKHLELLSLGDNSFDGPIPSSLGNLSSLISLYLCGNRLNGTRPSSLGLLSNLLILYIGNNSLAYTILEVHFHRLSKLKYLYVSSTALISKVKSNRVPPFQLEYLSMSSCQMGPNFPTWLQTQTSLQGLDISNSGIVDKALTWFWKWASHLEHIDLPDNQISGDLSGFWLNNTSIYLNSNCFTDLSPALSPNVIVLNMANNSFSGPISHFLCQKLNGRSKLEALDLSNNDLSGELPLCWKSWQSLTHVNLGNNNFSGPSRCITIGSLFSLKALHLQNNGLSGSIPSSLRDCTSLGLLDLSGNKLLGNIPNWIGELTDLKALCLRSNKFIGEIPSQICQLSSLTVLDVSDTELSGIIPRCLNNFSLMATIDTPDDLFTDLEYSSYELEGLYKGILKYVRMVVLSSNNFSGSIPTELSQLFGLRFLNVSQNHLMGRIPEKIGRMTSLLSLDLSTNHLSGEIPQSLANLTFLNLLNLSYNQFRGRIPLSTQLQSFDAFSYIGNAQLCGAPLTKNCTEDDESQGMDTIDENEEGSEMRWFYISMGLGFIKNWRYASFQFLYDVRDWVYVAVAIRLNWFRDNLRMLLGKQKD
ncbi:hypothetical protein PVL29_021025 [Vitis rotundifolia]|uniref:Leucine-rich repeat-containing N-terminal plant-type domain-containing protein n=1 Tax=Vitis rotundifolia TaxID=103349 RepID=A0AA38YYK6_VITRO|nr:hypothetical protein PVL29_021025 [Vitis rotundifolia]